MKKAAEAKAAAKTKAATEAKAEVKAAAEAKVAIETKSVAVTKAAVEAKAADAEATRREAVEAAKVDKKSFALEGTKKKVTSEKAVPGTKSLWPALLFPILLAMPLMHHNMSQEPSPTASRCTAPETSPPWPYSRNIHPPGPWTVPRPRW